VYALDQATPAKSTRPTTRPCAASLIRRGLSLLNVPEPADRVARQSALGDIEPEEFADLDDDYCTLEASLDLDAVMRAVMR
jgi:hypothetical protein